MTVLGRLWKNYPMGFLAQFLPRRMFSRLAGEIARIRWPLGLHFLINKLFAMAYKINLQEAEKPLSQYRTLVDFFTRKLREGARPIDGHAVVHPCDAEIVQHGPIDGMTLIQAKGLNYPVDVLTRHPDISEHFLNGYFLTYYLCPTDYHRVHSPVDGLITQCIYTEGDLWPVDPWGQRSIESLYCKNERVFVEIATDLGPVGLVFVGAMNVGSIVLSFDDKIKTNQMLPSKTYPYAPKIQIKKGEELGLFRLGSTVIVLYSHHYAEQLKSMNFNRRFVKMGQGLIP